MAAASCQTATDQAGQKSNHWPEIPLNMRKGIVRLTIVSTLSAAMLFGLGCSPDGDPPLPPPLLDEPIVEDGRDAEGNGHVVVRLEDGLGVYLFDGGSFAVDVRPIPFEGRVVHWQYHEFMKPDGSTEPRWIVVTVSGSDQNEQTTIIILGPSPQPPGLTELSRQTHPGKYESAITNSDAFEKTFLFGDHGWLLINLADGTAKSRSNQHAPSGLVSVEVVGGLVVIIEKWNQETEIRLRVFNTDGTIVATVVMPGDYVTSTTDGARIKAIVTRHNGRIFQDLVQVTTGNKLTQQPGNGMAGTHTHLQYDAVDGGRFVEIVYNSGRNETEVRIMHANGSVLSTNVLPGEFKRAVVTTVGTDQHKVIATEINSGAAATAINLRSGRQGSITQAPGTFEGLSVGAGGVKIKAGGQSLPVTLP